MATITKPKANSDKGVPPPVETANDNPKGSAGTSRPKKAKNEIFGS